MNFTFAPAVRTSTPMIIGIAGPSGSGKTFTALTLAMGLAADGKVALIDTEGRRALHYADLKDGNGPVFRFDHCDMESPYEPRRFLEALMQAEAAGYAVIVVDSFSDEYVGEGGLVDMAAAQKVPNEAAKWAKPKAEHKLVIRWLRQSRCHVIFCLRAEEKVRLEKIMKDGREQTVVVPIGWQPICEKNVPYEMATSFMLTPDAPGVPHPIKIQEQHCHLFPHDRPITRESGRLLAEWCAGGDAPKVADKAAAEPVGHDELPPSPPQSRIGPARAAVQRLRKEIAAVHFVEELNQRGIHGPSAKDDERLIRGETGGAAVWQDLVKRDADKRLELTPLPDDEIPNPNLGHPASARSPVV